MLLRFSFFDLPKVRMSNEFSNLFFFTEIKYPNSPCFINIETLFNKPGQIKNRSFSEAAFRLPAK